MWHRDCRRHDRGGNGALNMVQQHDLVTSAVGSRQLRPEELLMLAVLEQAFVDIDSSCPSVRADAEAYFFAYRPNSSVFSLDAVCGIFNLSVSAIREEARRRLRRGQHGKMTSCAA